MERRLGKLQGSGLDGSRAPLWGSGQVSVGFVGSAVCERVFWPFAEGDVATSALCCEGGHGAW